MSLHRRNPKRDATEKAIVDALRAYGCDVTRISGTGAPDLLVRVRSESVAGWARPWALEVKTQHGRRTKAQESSQWPIVRTVEEAIALVYPRSVGPWRCSYRRR